MSGVVKKKNVVKKKKEGAALGALFVKLCPSASRFPRFLLAHRDVVAVEPVLGGVL